LQVIPAAVSTSTPPAGPFAGSSSVLYDIPAVKAGGGQTSTERPSLIGSQRPGLAALLQDVSLYSLPSLVMLPNQDHHVMSIQ